MTTATLHTLAPVRGSLITDYLHRVAEAFAAWRETQRVTAALGNMSDHELKDIGLTRSDVDYVAHRTVLLP
mgnify:CR=1 FL=1